MQSADPPYTVRVGFFSVHSLASIGRVVYNRRKWDARLTRFSIYGTVKGPVLRGNIKKAFLEKSSFLFIFHYLTTVQSVSITSFIRECCTRHRTLILYFFIGASASLLDVAGFYLFHSQMGIVSTLATTYSVAIATVYAFLLNSHFNFKQTDRLLIRLFSYTLVSGVGLLISACMLFVFNVKLGFDGNSIKVLSLPIVFVVQYILNKKVTFQSTQR